MASVPNLWHLLNLENSPFFQDRLASGGDPAHPINLFVGRRGEVDLLLRTVGSTDGSRQAIPGAVGRGTTTLAQFVKSELARVRHVAAKEPVSIGSADTAAELLARILSSAYQTVLTWSRTGGTCETGSSNSGGSSIGSKRPSESWRGRSRKRRGRGGRRRPLRIDVRRG